MRAFEKLSYESKLSLRVLEDGEANLVEENITPNEYQFYIQKTANFSVNLIESMK